MHTQRFSSERQHDCEFSSFYVTQKLIQETLLQEKLNEEQERCIKLEVELDQHKRYLTVLKSIKDKEASKSNTLEKDLDTLNSVKQALERQVCTFTNLARFSPNPQTSDLKFLSFSFNGTFPTPLNI